MLDFVYIWIALALVFLLASAFGEADARFGYVSVGVFSCVFWLVGWIPDIYAATAIPLVLGLAVITFLKEQFRVKMSVYGSASSLIWRIMGFMIFLQFAIVFTSGLAMFNYNTQMMDAVNNTVTQNYKLENVNSVYGQYTTVSAVDAVAIGLQLVWMSWNITWNMLLSTVLIYPNLVTVFHLSPSIAVIISAGFYIMIGLEIFVLIYKPLKPPGV